MPLGKVRRLHKRPGQIFILVLAVTFALLLAVTRPGGLHAPAVRTEIAYSGKSFNVARLQHDRQTQDLPDPRNGQQLHIFRPELDFLQG